MPHACILSSVHIALDNRVFYREARSLHKAGYRVTIIAVHPRDETKYGIDIVALPKIQRWLRPVLWLRLLRLAFAARADIYHFHDPELLLVSPWLRLLTGRPVIYDVHESYPEFVEVKEYLPHFLRGALAGLLRWLEPALARLQTGLIFSDAQIAAAFSGVPLPKQTLYNLPDRSFVDEGAAATAAGAPREPVVLYLGGMERNRGSHLLLEAFHQVHAAMPEARLLLVGHFEPASLREEIQTDAERLGVAGALRIAGRVPFEEIGGYLARASVGWVPWQAVAKNDKNVPTKLFEYMAYGLPVVSSDLASTRPFVRDGENGCLVAAEDAQAHAKAILHLLRDPEVARAMGERGQAKVQAQWNWDEMGRLLIRFYERLMVSG
ncbi:MAG TPA: glycosyltransferase family 4 protein [Anaerolineae bacterium]|nr:glycosyltransferase family 4 protein [Anaerolineae bacterium]